MENKCKFEEQEHTILYIMVFIIMLKTCSIDDSEECNRRLKGIEKKLGITKEVEVPTANFFKGNPTRDYIDLIKDID